MTLIAVANSEGERRCDKRCYDARTLDCDCVCGGMNHGKGLARAQENTREHARQLPERIKAADPTAKTHVEAIQKGLFE